MKISQKQINCALLRVEPGLEKYLWIQSNVRTVDVSADSEFQKKFNRFYRVRRNAEWRSHFYRIMEQSKINGAVDFSSILESISNTTGNLEASFGSKLIATLDTEKPVIDKFR